MEHTGARGTLEVALLAVVVSVAQTAAPAIGVGAEAFALTAPLAHRPWTIVVSVYAHGGIGHLLTNLLGLLVFGVIVERRSVRGRFHAFVLGTGAIAGMAEVVVGSFFGPAPFVLGISGAVFGLMGYVLSSNPVTDSLLGRFAIDLRVQVVLMVLIAAGITWMTRGERVALVAHFVGFTIGLIAGRLHLLRA